MKLFAFFLRFFFCLVWSASNSFIRLRFFSLIFIAINLNRMSFLSIFLVLFLLLSVCVWLSISFSLIFLLFFLLYSARSFSAWSFFSCSSFLLSFYSLRRSHFSFAFEHTSGSHTHSNEAIRPKSCAVLRAIFSSFCSGVTRVRMRVRDWVYFYMCSPKTFKSQCF